MVTIDHIKLLKDRSFGEILGDTFTFVRLNLGTLIATHVVLSFPVILVIATIFLFGFPDYFTLIKELGESQVADFWETQRTWLKALVMWSFYYSGMMVIGSNTLIVVDQYSKSMDGAVTFQEVFTSFKKSFLKLFLAKLIVAPLVMISTAIMIFPGIAFRSLFLVPEMLILQHNYPVGQALKKSTSIMSREYWNPLFVFVTLSLVFFLLSSMPGVSLIIFSAVQENLGGSIVDSAVADIGVSVFKVVNLMGWFLLYSIPSVGIGITYFSVKEKISRKGIMERINHIGIKEKPVNIYQEDEQY